MYENGDVRVIVKVPSFLCHKALIQCQAGIDAPGALHQIIFFGIEHRPIFRDSKDRDYFLEHLVTVITETLTLYLSCHVRQ